MLVEGVQQQVSRIVLVVEGLKKQFTGLRVRNLLESSPLCFCVLPRVQTSVCVVEGELLSVGKTVFETRLSELSYILMD